MNKTNMNNAAALSMVALLALVPLAACNKPAPPNPQATQASPRISDLQQRANAGDAEAQADLGEAYAHGEGLPKDAVKASELLRAAAEKGVAKAQYELARLYEKGEGVPQDSAKAAELIKQSAKNGYAKAQAALGDMYAKGRGVVRDDVLAYVWSSLAVAQGNDDAKQTQDTVSLNQALRDEAERLKAKWKRGMEIVREKQEQAIPAQAPTSSAAKW